MYIIFYMIVMMTVLLCRCYSTINTIWYECSRCIKIYFIFFYTLLCVLLLQLFLTYNIILYLIYYTLVYFSVNKSLKNKKCEYARFWDTFIFGCLNEFRYYLFRILKWFVQLYMCGCGYSIQINKKQEFVICYYSFFLELEFEFV